MLVHLDHTDMHMLAEMARERAEEVRSGERSGDVWTAEDYDGLALRCLAEAQR
jgi:hypothetical protein